MKRLLLILLCVFLVSCATSSAKLETQLTEGEAFVVLNFDSNVTPFKQNVHYIDFGPGTPSLLGFPAYEIVKPGVNVFKVSNYKLYLSIIFNRYGSIEWPDKSNAVVISPMNRSIVYVGDIYADVHDCGDKRCVSYRVRDNEEATVGAAKDSHGELFRGVPYKKIVARFGRE